MQENNKEPKNDTRWTWIQTRDGSPTLWSNELAEPFRSVRGAFTESFKVFVEPILLALKANPKDTLTIGEFGLGPGTNWILTELFLRPLVKKLSYFAVEKDTFIFEMGLEKWRNSKKEFFDLAAAHSLNLDEAHWEATFSRVPSLLTFPNLKLAVQSGIQVDYWFHDPFGYDVNPEGYSEENMKECRHFFKMETRGLTYACNKFFQSTLEKAKFRYELLPSGDQLLKREKLVFKI